MKATTKGRDAMRAVVFTGNPVSYVYSKVFGGVSRSAYHDRLSCVRLVDLPAPALPRPDWVRVRVSLAGICGSDLNLIRLHNSPSISALTSFPFVIGHEIVGAVEELGPGVPESVGLQAGQRVVVDPVLSCRPRGRRELCPACLAGEYSRCDSFDAGPLAPGMLIGACRDTGGGWSEGLVCHHTQVFPLPAGLSDEAGVMVEPFCAALHPVVRNLPPDSGSALVVGCGVIGLCTIAALRALDRRCRIVALARHPFQAELARKFGADEVVGARRDPADYYPQLAAALGTRLLRPLFGKAAVPGGADVVYDCVGSATSIDDALRFTRPGGTMALVGLAASPGGVDWAPVWAKEIRIAGSFAYGTETWEGERLRTHELALRLLAGRGLDLSPLVTHRFPLRQYREALSTVMDKKGHGVLKAVLSPDGPG